MTEHRERVAGVTIFTKLDLKDSYHLIRIKKRDEWKPAFHTIWTLRIQSKAIWFVQCARHVPSHDEHHPTRIPGSRSSSILDDILIYSKTMDEHEALVQQVLAWLERHDLAVSLKKSVFHVNTVESLGYIVGKSGVTRSEKKVKSILNWRAPRSVKDVQIFIGFANVYRCFIENF